MPRLFTGIYLPDNIRQHLMLIKSGLTGARWISPENYHITLRFAGDLENRKAHEFANALETVACEPFSIRLKGIGSFGGNKPNTVWADIEGQDELRQLQRSHEQIARSVGLHPESRNYTPHVTIARLQRGKVNEVAQFLESFGDFSTDWFEVNNFILYSARPNRGGGPYVIEESYPMELESMEDYYE